MNTIKISSWNVAGLRACTRKNAFQQYLALCLSQFYLKRSNPDILCLSETKCLQNQIGLSLPGYKVIWNDCKSKKGYAGVGILTKFNPIKVDMVPFDKELTDGRIIVIEFQTFYLINTYVPNAGENLKFMNRKEKWNDKMRELINKLNSTKPLIWAGDMNTAYLKYDVYDGETNKNRSKSAGFTDYEREHFTKYFTEFGYVDAYRHIYPNEREKAMTYWSYLGNNRATGRGWRLDYFIVSPVLKSSLKDVVVMSDQMGSDHAPIELTFEAKEEFQRVETCDGEKNGVGKCLVKTKKNKKVVKQVSIKAMVSGLENGIKKSGVIRKKVK